MNATQYRGQIGQMVSFNCPAIPTLPSASVWGTGLYTDDSPVCLAAVHAGALNPSAGGTVTIQIAAGQPSYTGSMQFGITSSNYGGWDGSFAVLGAATMPGSGGSTAYPPPDQASNANATTCQGGPGTQCTYGCTPGFPLSSSVWGTGVYTDDSKICSAAVHSGVITQAGGGWVIITIVEGQASYAPSSQYGVTSSGYGQWSRSFIVNGSAAAPGGGSGGGNAGGPCADPQTQVAMDEWLSRAQPIPAGNLRYEPWGRLVGTSSSAVITAPNPPDTSLSRCEYLLQQAPGLPSRNIGTLQEYLQKYGLI
jgi:hypothetical protein